MTLVLPEVLKTLPKKTEKPQSLLVVLRHRNDTLWREVFGRSYLYGDHVIFLTPQDLPQPGSEDPDELYLSKNPLRAFLSHVSFDKFDSVNIISRNSSSTQLEIILGELWPSLLPSCDLTIGGFQVTADQLNRLTSNFSALEFVACTFGRGWWKSPPGNKPCTELRMDCCVGVLPREIGDGQAGWDSLKSINVRGRERPLILRRKGNYEVCLLPKRDYQVFAEAWIRAFWAPTLKDANLFDLDSADCLKVLPPRSSLRSLWVDSGVTPSVMEWVVKNSNLLHLQLAWAPGVRLPWPTLKKLKRLRSLNVEDTCLADEELAEIAAHTRLRSISTYYTDLTPQSWPLILSWPGLKRFWGSQELAFETPPLGLPETTELQKFVALNTRFPWFEDFLRRYPNVKVVDM